MREKSVVGAASGISSSLWARLGRRAVVWKEAAHVCRGDNIEGTCLEETGCACVLVATGGVVIGLLFRYGRAGFEGHWRAEEKFCSARRGRAEGRMVGAIDYGELKGSTVKST